MYSIGKSTRGKDLWMLRLGTQHADRSPPSILLLGNLHGDEAVGREVLLQLSTYLCNHSNENFIEQVGVGVGIYMHTHTCALTRMRTHSHTHTHTHTHTQTHTHTHTQTHTHM